MNGEEEFEVVNSGTGNEDDDYFDEVCGCLQELLLNPEFDTMQKQFSTQHCMKFEATEENKLIYTTIFNEYTSTIEAYINTQLSEMIQGFSMERFIALLETRKDQIEETILDLLLSFSDFESFKEMMLFARAHFVATTPKPTSGKAASLGLKSSAQIASERAQAQAAAQQNEEAKESIGIVGQTVVEGQAQKLDASDMMHFENTIDGLMIAGKASRFHEEE